MKTSLAASTLLAIATIVSTAPCLAADAPSPEAKKQASALMQACRADAERLCASVERGGGRKLICLKSHASELTPACRDALPKGDATKGGAMAK